MKVKMKVVEEIMAITLQALYCLAMSVVVLIVVVVVVVVVVLVVVVGG